MPSFKPFLFTVLSLIASTIFFGDESAGTDATSLDAALKAVNASGGTIVFDVLGGVSLGNQVRAVQSDRTFTFVPGITITIEGMKQNLNGSGTNNRGLFVGGRNATTTGSVHINNLHFVNCRAKGGNGGTGGGGGLGAGGGLFVGENTNVFLRDCTFSSCSATGGNGQNTDSTIWGGGGGMRGNGGSSSSTDTGGGGGGFGGNGGVGTSADAGGGGGGGAHGFPDGNGGTPSPGRDFDGMGTSGQSGVGGSGGNLPSDGSPGGFGGGGGGNKDGITGGNGGFGGGGGGGAFNGGFGGDGEFGGGGGAGGYANKAGFGGNGGFGAGGGASSTPHSTGGFGGGDSSAGGLNGISGNGAGFGGAIFIQSKGNLTIETTSSFTGTLFNNNSAAAGDGGTANTDPNAGFGALGQDIFMMSAGSLTFDLATPLSMQNPIQGNIGSEGEDQATGGLMKKGSALLTLSGDHTYTGKTTLDAGELQINGSVISEVEVKEGTTLSGNFTAKKMGTNPNSGNLTNSGTISPGVNGVGIIHVEGVYTQTSKGKLVINMTPTGDGSSKILGATSANLDGTLELVLSPGNYVAGTPYLITEAPTNGTMFANVVKTGELADLIDIRLTYGSTLLTILSSHIFEDQNINPGVPQDVADCIIAASITPGSDFATMVEILGTLSDSQVNKALTSLSAVQFGALEWINARNNSYAADILTQHLFELRCHPKRCGANGWVSVFGNFMDQKKQIDNLQKFDANAVNLLAGIDFHSSPCFFYGAGFGYSHTAFDWKNHGGKGTVNSYYGTLYGSWIGKHFNTGISFLGGGNQNESKRKIIFASVDRTAEGDFWGYFFTAHLDLKGNFRCSCCRNTWEPFILADYHYYTHKKFTEKGAESLNLRVRSKRQQIMRGEGGLKWYYEVGHDCYCYVPYLGLSLVGEFPLGKSKQPAQFVDQSCVIDALCYDSGAQFGAAQAGIKLSHRNGTSFSLGYKGLYNNKIHINEIEGCLEWIF